MSNVEVSAPDFNGTSTLNFTDLEFVKITTGSFAEKGFSKGACEATLEGAVYTGEWNGVTFLKPLEKKIYLKGAVTGQINATAEGYLTESVPNSNIYDKYQATWKIGRLGGADASATINVNGAISYQDTEYPNTELYLLQANIETTPSGDYDPDPLNVVLTHLRVVREDSPYVGEGFSIISYNSNSGAGQGWTYDRLLFPGMVEMKGLFSSPLFGIASATLDESQRPRTLSLNIKRIDLGKPPAPDLKVKVWGPTRVSPGQTVDYTIEYRNDGLKVAEDIAVGIEVPEFLEHISSTEGGIFLPSESPSTELWFESSISPKTKGNKTIKVKVPWGLTQWTPINISAYVGFTSPEIRDGFCPKKEEIIYTPLFDIGDCCGDGSPILSVTEIRKVVREYPLKPLVKKNNDGTCAVTFRCRTWTYDEKRKCTRRCGFSPFCENFPFSLGVVEKLCENWQTVQNNTELKERTVLLDCDYACSLNPEDCSDDKKSNWNGQITPAHDPNIKYGPSGAVVAGQKLDYKIEFENEGEGIAFGVYFTDTLDEDLDDSTLVIGPVIQIIDGVVGPEIGPPGTYNPATRTITWFVSGEGEIGPNVGGYAEISVNVKSGSANGTEIINYGTVYFPSVPEETRTNAIVSRIPLIEFCDDGIDNDGDGLIDCDDPDCSGQDCVEGEAQNNCNDGIDNDGDSFVDCADRDSDCPPCPEDCTNGIDDDEDGYIDCDDPDCANSPACCDNSIDYSKGTSSITFKGGTKDKASLKMCVNQDFCDALKAGVEEITLKLDDCNQITIPGNKLKADRTKTLFTAASSNYVLKIDCKKGTLTLTLRNLALKDCVSNPVKTCVSIKDGPCLCAEEQFTEQRDRKDNLKKLLLKIVGACTP